MPDQTQDPNQGMTFDAAPVQQDTPVTPAQSAGGMTFDSSPVQEATPVDKIPDPMQGASAEDRAFLKANPDHVWKSADPKFPNRPAGIYPTSNGNEWRNDPEVEQHPIDLHMLKHTAEYGIGSAAAVGGPIATMEGALALPAVLPHTIEGVKAIGQWASKNPMQAYLLYNVIKDFLPGAKKAIGLVKALPMPGE